METRRAKNVAYEFSIDKLEGIQGVVAGTKEIGANNSRKLRLGGINAGGGEVVATQLLKTCLRGLIMASLSDMQM